MNRDEVRHWFAAVVNAGHTCQPSKDPRYFPSVASLVAEANIPTSVREFYKRALFDFGGAWVHRQTIGENDVLFVHVGTDGDDGWLEVFDATGVLLDAAFLTGIADRVHWEPREVARARLPKVED